MPTGYTAKLMENGQSFNDFIMNCARAMGACITMRDDSSDAEIPNEFKPSKYAAKSVKKDQKKLDALLAIKDKGKVAYALNVLNGKIDHYEKYKKSHAEEDARLESMQRQVTAWRPPSDDHDGLKDFMLQQISVSKNNSNGFADGEIAKIEARKADPLGYFEELIITARSDMRRSKEYLAEDVERCKSRTEWIQQLRKSLGIAGLAP